MRLDWNLIRTILAHVEAETIKEFLEDADSISQWKEGQLLSERLESRQNPAQVIVLRHIKLLSSANYVSELLGVAYTQIRNPDSNLRLFGRS